MPYVSNLTEDEKKKQQQQSGLDVSNNNSSSFASAQNTSAQAPKPVANSGSWVNMQSYLNANKDNTGAMADKVVNNVNQQGQTAQTGINTLKQTAPGVINKVNADDWFTNPDANKKEQYNALKTTGGYTGPDSVDKIQGYADTQSAAQKAKQQADSLNNEAGRFNLLQDAYARPNYSQGAKKLDNTLLRQDATAKQKFEGANNQWQGILDQFNDASAQANTNINTNKQTALSNKNDLLAAETNAKNNLINPIQARASQANLDNKALADRALADAQDETLSDETMALLGLSEGQNLYGTNLSNYMTPDYTQVGLNNAATADERARYQALASMIGDTSMNQITADGKAITPVNFNKEQFNKDIAAQQAEYENFRNTDKGRFFDWAQQAQKSGEFAPKDAFGGDLPISGDFWNSINDRTLAQLEAEQADLINQNKGAGVFGSAYEQALPKYIQSLKNKYQADRKVKKG
jgi:hypothetical protein